ncbi:MAG: hypothetical protein LUG99_10810 [Lachnospiraceae bacterium]|nr:hypothetical protein [Lachnospiraceae bacterium]
MLSSKEYYGYVNEHFVMKNKALFRGCEENLLVARPMPDGFFDELLELLDRVQEKYEFDAQKWCVPNYNKFILWQEEFCGGCKKEALIAATKLILFCCLVDRFLDSARFSADEKEKICSKLHVEYFISEKEYKSDEFTELDELINDVRIFLTDDTKVNQEDREMIVTSMDKAFLSEIYMYKSPLKVAEAFDRSELEKLTDKSVEFEFACFLLASVNHNSERSRQAAACAGRIFWLADDLDDFVEDVNCKIKNSILFYCVDAPEEIRVQDRVEQAFANIDIFIERLEQEIALFQRYVGGDLYRYMLNKVWEWCKDVRKHAE